MNTPLKRMRVNLTAAPLHAITASPKDYSLEGNVSNSNHQACHSELARNLKLHSEPSRADSTPTSDVGARKLGMTMIVWLRPHAALG